MSSDQWPTLNFISNLNVHFSLTNYKRFKLPPFEKKSLKSSFRGLLHLISDANSLFFETLQVNQSSGRVYILKFCTDDRRLFFWMQVISVAIDITLCFWILWSCFEFVIKFSFISCQEPAADNDAQLCSSVNFYLNQPLGNQDLFSACLSGF